MSIDDTVFDEKDVLQFFVQVFGRESRYASVDQFIACMNDLKSTLSPTAVKNQALLFMHAGIVILDQENPAKAVKFFHKSVRFFERAENETPFFDAERVEKSKNAADKHGTFELKKMLAEVLMARCWVRNYDNLEQAREIVDKVILQLENSEGILSAEVYMNALLAKFELMLEHGKGDMNFEEMNQICHEKVNSPIGLLKHKDDHSVLGRLGIDLAAMFCNFANCNPISCSTSSIVFTTYPDEEVKYYIAKAILRQGKPLVDLRYMDAEGCVFSKEGLHWNDCALANAYYIKGEHFLGKSLPKAIEAFAKSYEIRVKHLGPSHVETARAQFEMGRAMARKPEKSRKLDSCVFELMETALYVFNLHNKGLHTMNSDALSFYAEILCKWRYDGINEAIPYINTCLQNEKIMWGDCLTIPSLRQLKFGELYEQFQRWTEAVELYEAASRGLNNKSEYASHLVDVYCHLGYCYSKLGKYEIAEEKFNRSRGYCRQYGVDKNDKKYIKLLLNQAENAFLNQNIDLSRKLFQQGLSLKQARLIDSELLMNQDETWQSIHLRLAFYYEYVKMSLTTAEEYYLQVLDSVQKVFFYGHPAICHVLLALSRVCLKLGNVSLSEDHIFKCLSIQGSCLKSNDLLMELILSNFNQLLGHRKSLTKAKSVFLNYLDRFSQLHFLEDSFFVASFSFNFAKRLYSEMSASNDSLTQSYTEIFEKCFRTFCTLCGARSLNTAQTERMLGLCFLKSGQLALAEWHLCNNSSFLQLHQ